MPRLAKCAIASLILLFGANAPAYAQHMRIEAVARTPDGKVLAAGRSTDTGTDLAIVVERLNVDGTVDGSFGTGGTFTIPSNSAQSDFHPSAIAAQPDGKIIIAAIRDGYLALVRIMGDGSGVDAQFGTTYGTGIMIDTSSAGQSAAAVIPGSAGDTYIVGTYAPAGTNARAGELLHYDAQGWRDSMTPISYPNANDINAAILTPQGDILAAGATLTGSGDRAFAVFLFDLSGNPITSFGYNGMASMDVTPGADDQAFGVFMDAEGRILAVGKDGGWTNTPGHNLTVVRFNADGTLDGTFGYQGAATNNVYFDPSGYADSVARSIVELPNGEYVVMGTASDDANARSYFAIWHMSAQGGDIKDPFASPTDFQDDILASVFYVPGGTLGTADYVVGLGTREDPNGTPDTALRVRYFADTSDIDTESPSTDPDSTPNAFSFEPVGNAMASTTYGGTFRVTGVNMPVQISITGSDGAAYSVSSTSNCYGAPQTASPSTIENGTYVCAFVPSSANPDTTTSATVTVGTASATLLVKTGSLYDTTVTSYPSPTSTTATIGFASIPAGAGTFQCSLDGAAFTYCYSPSVTYSGLAEGSHTFAVRAVSNFGPDPTPASYGWDIGLMPTVSIMSRPSSLTNSASASFTFSSNSKTATFLCSIDGAAYAACTSPATYTLADGAHTFSVEAVNTSGTSAAASATWTVDTTPPDTTITDGAPNGGYSNSTSPIFRFTSDDPNATFECQLDGAGFKSCVSGWQVSTPDGQHTFQVRAKDRAGNYDPTPASVTWIVDTTPVTVSISSGVSGYVTTTSATFVFTANKQNVTYKCKFADTNSFSQATATPCTSPVSYSALADKSYEFAVTATDQALNSGSAANFFTVDTTPPDTTISSGPAHNSASISISFYGTDTSAMTYQCTLDAGAWTACTSPYTASSVADGQHTFNVKAIDAAGNVDPTPASITWTTDTIPPSTTITGTPANPSRYNYAVFQFTSNEAGGTFQCKLDAGGFATCTSGGMIGGLSEGSHAMTIRAVDAAGNVDPNPPSFTWTIDLTAPDTAIAGAPQGSVSSKSATIAVSSPDSTATFECSLDNAAFSACTSPVALSNLAEGSHTFQARARDPAGNVDATPASATWTVDTIPPDTTISAAPAGTVATNSATVNFYATESPVTYQCSIDNAAYAVCTSPVTISGLADGGHTFAVRAVDAAGNIDPTPAAASWAVDTTPPQTTVTSAPTSPWTSPSGSIGFSSSEAGSTFQCRIDGGAWQACASPTTVSGLADGSHLFEVYAIDAVGNVDATPAQLSFTVDATPPDTTITSGPASLTNQATATFAFSSSRGGTAFLCSLDGASATSCASPTTYSGLANGTHSFAVQAVDPLRGNDPSPASYSWTVDTIAPDTTITSGPSGNNNPSTATFAFTSSESNSTFQCKLDTGSYAACVSPITYSNLVKGSHTFSVRAIDAAGNVDGTPATRSWSTK